MPRCGCGALGLSSSRAPSTLEKPNVWSRAERGIERFAKLSGCRLLRNENGGIEADALIQTALAGARK